MAILNITGFETGDSGEALSSAGTFSIQNSIVRTGVYALRVNPTTTATGAYHLAGPTIAQFNSATTYTRFYFRPATLPSADSEEIFGMLTQTAANKFFLRIDSAGNLMAFASDGTTQIGSTGSADLIDGSTWYRIEVSVATGASAAIEVKVDGTVDITGTGNTTVSNGSRVMFGKINDRNGESVDFYYDDAAVSDSAYPGAGAIELMAVDGDGSAVTWTIGAGAGSDYENVDEIPSDGNTTYLLSTLSAGDASLVTVQSSAAAGVSGTINVVKAAARCIRDGAADGTYLTRILSGVDTSDSASLASASSYQTKGHLAAVDPATAVAWTTSGLDAVEVGVVENEATDRTRCSSIYLMVDFTVAAASGPAAGTLALMGVGK